MNQFAKVWRGVRRNELGSLRVGFNLLAINANWLFSAKCVARAASELRRWPIARQYWDAANVDTLSMRDTELYVRALLFTRGWAEASAFIEAALGRGLDSVTLRLEQAEASWRLGDSADVDLAREAAIALLPKRTDGASSLIRNENQIVDIPSRLALLQQVEGYLHEIRDEAAKVTAIEDRPRAYMYWDSGFTNAPAIVQACKKHAKGSYGDDLVELSASNLGQYVSLGSHLNRVAKLWPAQYADMVRMQLMASRGGVWLDATVYTQENSLLEAKYRDGDFFVFNYNGPRIANWFMVSKAGSYQARMLYAAMNAYWRHNRRLKNYFVFHDMFEVLYHLDEQFREGFERSSHIHASPYLRAQTKLLFQPYDEQKFADILELAPIQKLTYKPGNKNHGAGTLYQQLCQQA